MQQTSTNITKVGRVIIPVSDQDKALEFYTGTLGFEVRADMPFGDGDRWLEVAPRGSAARRSDSAAASPGPSDAAQRPRASS